MKIYSIFDRVAGIYSDLLLLQNNKTAIRQFKACFEGKNYDKADFDLVCLGSFDEETGKLVALSEHEFVINGGSLDEPVQ